MKREDELRETLNYAANLIKSSLDMIVSTDKDRIIVEFNSAASRTFGYSKDEVAGKHVGILYSRKEDAEYRITFNEGIYE